MLRGGSWNNNANNTRSANRNNNNPTNTNNNNGFRVVAVPRQQFPMGCLQPLPADRRSRIPVPCIGNYRTFAWRRACYIAPLPNTE
ncbi:MAG TPA: hypothetical protein PL033_20145 [Candidatus Brocadiia bacterium]|nr:hypothetical protein [Candidatus Brocadiia bacterium]